MPESPLAADTLAVKSVGDLEKLGLQETLGPGYELPKRLLDVLGAAVGLLLLSPLFLVIALIIKRDSPGPVFYRRRVMARAIASKLVWGKKTDQVEWEQTQGG